MPSSTTNGTASTAKPAQLAKPAKPIKAAPVPVKSAPRARPAAPKRAAKPAVKAVAKEKTAVAPAEKKPAKPRVKLVRDGFTMPEADFALIAELKKRALGAKREAKKSELLRAGLRVLAALDAKALLAALEQLEPVKTGRPKKGH